MFRQHRGIYVAIGARPPGSWFVGSASLRRFGVPPPRCGSSCVVALCWRAVNFTAIRPFPVGGPESFWFLQRFGPQSCFIDVKGRTRLAPPLHSGGCKKLSLMPEDIVGWYCGLRRCPWHRYLG